MANIIEYSSKATAARGISRAGITDKAQASELLFKAESGKWCFDQDAVDAAMGVGGLSEGDQELKIACGFVECPSCGIHLSNGLLDFDTLSDQHGAVKAYRAQKHEWACMGCGHEWGAQIAPPAKSAAKGQTKPHENKSLMEGAVSASHAIFDALPEGTRRKDAIQEAVQQGVAFYTARTQYQKWFTAKRK